MSVLHEMLSSVEQAEPRSVTTMRPSMDKDGVVFELPDELVKDYYDLKEYLRIATQQEDVRVLSIANSLSGEGSSSIATYLAFLMTGARTRPMGKVTQKKFGDSKNWQKLHANDNPWSNVSGVPSSVLLVDANLHSPSLNRFFGVSAQPGLADILEGKAVLEEAVHSIRGTNFMLLCAGRTAANPAELISNDYFNSLVKEWRQQFQYVIFDSPAVLKSAEAMSLAACVDGVVLVVRAGHTRWDSAQNAKRRLITARSNVLGVTLNRRKMEISDGLFKSFVETSND
ncbi:MAG: CpsD/CapB family tyrosine-protein kinase [candidate division KSB1 bacterium]|nr:CpsD/CapB family tyrosine-protein kinase [candidate division KSB1 bacterium]